MGYFNYFIKCIIRNITYKLCKPKVFLTVLLCVVILFFCFRNYGYCGYTEGEVVTVNPTDEFINENTGQYDAYIQYDNSFLTVKQFQEEAQREFIITLYSIYAKDKTNATSIANTILSRIYNVNYADNVGIYIQRAGAASQYRVNFYHQKELSASIGKGAYVTGNSTMYFINVPYQTANCERYVLDLDDNFVYSNNTTVLDIPVAHIGVFVSEWITMFRDFGLISSPEQETLKELQNQNNLINEQNKIQQEQNDILTNDDVDTDGLQFATDDTVNPTSDGFNTLFTSIYNAFCNTSSAPLKVTLPFVNQSFTISPNLVSNAMQKCGLGVVVTLIQSYYYYGVCLFIYKDINKIIENLKSGNLTADCGNVKTEVL